MNYDSIVEEIRVTTLRSQDLRRIYSIKRFFLFLDEWCFYAILILLHYMKIPPLVVTFVLGYGAMALVTSYKNIGVLENQMLALTQKPGEKKDLHGRRWFFWPFVAED